MRAMDAPLSVKRLLEQVKTRIEPPFSAVCVMGEVSNFKVSGKHWYFTLKEEGAAIGCAVWASAQRFLPQRPADGQRVVLKGSLDLYVPGGSLKLIVTHCEPAGVGDLQARLRQLEAELRGQGFFDRPRRPLPRFPRRLGVVAALGGAALRDVLEVTARRAPGIDLLIAPAAAQGERCVPETLLALQELQDPHWGCEALLLVRGGARAIVPDLLGSGRSAPWPEGKNTKSASGLASRTFCSTGAKSGLRSGVRNFSSTWAPLSCMRSAKKRSAPSFRNC